MTVLQRRLTIGLGAGLPGLCAFGLLAWWLNLSPGLAPQEPLADRPGYGPAELASGPALALPIGRDFHPGKPGAATTLASLDPISPAGGGVGPADWPGFRGALHTNAAPDGPALSDLSDFSPHRVLWSAKLGEGHAGAAVASGRVYVLDYDETAKAETLRCLSLADGGELWNRSWPLKMKRNHGYSRTVPAIWDRYVLSIGPLGQVMCLDRFSGALVWALDPAAAWQGTVPLWYGGQCPLIDDGTLVLAVGGTVLAAGIEVSSGKVLWTTPNDTAATTTHASVMPMRVGGTSCYLAAFSTGLFGLSLDGEVLFRVPDWTVQVEVPSPVVLPGNRVYLTAGYGGGNMMLGLEERSGGPASGGSLAWRILFHNKPGTALSCEQQTPIPRGDYLYGIQTKDAGSLHDQFVCMDLDGRMVWTSDRGRRFGLGPYLLADGKFFILGDDGWLTVAVASPDGYRELSRNRVFEATDAWAPLALAGTRLLLRDEKNLLCLDLSRAAEGKS